MLPEGDIEKYRKFCLQFAFDFLTEQDIWSYVEKLSELLLKKDNLTPDENELFDFFCESGFDELLKGKVVLFIENITQSAVLN